MTTAIIPHPGDDLVPEGWWQSTVVPWADEQASIDDVASATAHIVGLIGAYRTLGSDTLELTKARRYLELRWGQLLGDVTERQRTDLDEDLSHAGDSLSKDDRLRFRQLASGRDQVFELLEHATDPDDITRAACIRFARPPAPSARDAHSAIGFADDDGDEPTSLAESWTASHDRARRRIVDLLADVLGDLQRAGDDPTYSAATRASLIRLCESRARQATGQLGELAFSLER
jgi:hypothetical protein